MLDYTILELTFLNLTAVGFLVFQTKCFPDFELNIFQHVDMSMFIYLLIC